MHLILCAVFLLGVAFTIFSSKTAYEGVYRDINELYSIVLFFYSVVFIMFSKNGFHSGASVFSMADVNLVFTSPVKSSTVLSFGLFQQLGKSVTLGFFILYQSTLVCSTYGTSFISLVYILLGYALTVLLSQMTAMLIYSFTCSNEKKKRAIKGVYYFVIAFFAGLLLYLTKSRGEISLVSLGETLRERVFLLFPVSGVTSLFCEGAISQSAGKALAGLVLTALLICLFYAAVSLMNTDYYEDVLKATEISFSAITSRKEGKAQENAPMNVKVGKTGFSRGFGASAISEKHKIENRRSKVFALNITSIVFVLMSAVYCFIFSDSPVGIFALNVYMLTITVGTSRWAKEFSYPYAYLIPEKPYKKLLNLLKCEIPNITLESILCFLPVHFILRQGIALTVSMILARISFGFLFIAVNMVLQRIFGSADKQFLVGFAYFALIMLFSLPGVTSGVFLGMLLPFNTHFAYFAVAMINSLVSMITLYCTRNVLIYSEINGK